MDHNAKKDWFRELEDVMARLRSHEGCPWDKQQTHDSLKKYLIEEAYELIDAIDRRENKDILEELGDVLLQVVFHSQIASESEQFSFQDVAKKCCEKLIRRHPHVFGNADAKTTEEVLENWRAIKALEKQGTPKPLSVLDGVSRHLPALLLAEKIQRKATNVGFDWPDLTGVLNKVEEELEEVKEALQENDPVAIGEEIGDLLFVLVRLSQFKGMCAEALLRTTVNKFYDRFQFVESETAKAGKALESCSLQELETYWNQAKKQSKGL